MRLRVTILLAALAVASGASASWTQAVASGGPTNVAVHSSRDASRDHLYLTRNIAHTILKWDGSTLTSFAGPTGSSMDTSLTVDVDETDNAIYASGAKSSSPNDGVRCRAALPLTGTPTWTCHVSDANKYAANAIRLAYGGATYLTAYLGTPGAATAAIQRRSTWNGTATTVQALHAGSPGGGIIGFLVKLSESLALAVAPIASSNDVDIVSVTNDPSDAAGRTTRNNVTSGSVNSLTQPYPFGENLVWAATDGADSYVETTAADRTVAHAQTLASVPYFRVGPTIGGTQYGAVGLTLYSRTSATADFTDASDPVPGTGEFVVGLTLSHDGTQLMAWRSDGAAYTLDLVAEESTPTIPRRRSPGLRSIGLRGLA